MNAVRHTRRIRKIYLEVDLWLSKRKSEIKNREMNHLKTEIEQRFLGNRLPKPY